MVSVIDLQIARLGELLAAARRQHRQTIHLTGFMHELRMQQLRGECRDAEREYWVRSSNRVFNEAWQKENGIKPDTRGHGSQCGAELGQDVRPQR